MSTRTKIRPHIRWMIHRDYPEVCAIERCSFEFPWSEEDFIRCLRERNCIGTVAEHEERVLGFMVYELHKSRLHILNFAVHPDCRYRGIGSALTRHMINKLSAGRRTRIMLEVRETNLDAQLFFKPQGFEAATILHNFYKEWTEEDAYLFQYRYQQDHLEPVQCNRITRLQ